MKKLGHFALLSLGFLMSEIVFGQTEPTMDEVYAAAKSGQLDKAQTMIQQVLIGHPNSAKAHYVQAEIAARQNQLPRAREALANAERLSPGLPFAKAESVQTLRTQLGGSSGATACRGADARMWTNCFGTQVYSNGNKYVGEFINGKKNGEGTFYYADGRIYMGEWVDNYANGRHIVFASDGSVKESGIFKRMRLVTSQYVDPNSFTRIATSSIAPAIRGGAMSPEEWLASQANQSAPAIRGSAMSPEEWLASQTNQSAPTVSDGQRVEAERLKNELDKERQRLIEEKRKFDVEKTQREQAKLASRISIQVAATTPDADGDFVISIQTSVDTASLKVDDEEQGYNKTGFYTIRRVARVGVTNTITISAKDIYGNTDTKTISVARQAVDSRPTFARLNPANIKPQPARDAVAIIIGIQNYKLIPKAEYASQDAQVFYDYASRALGIKQENIKLLLDDEADVSGIYKAFQNWLPLKVRKGKTDVYVFYSGHGLPSTDGKSLYFLPVGADRDLIAKTAISQKEIVDALKAAQPKSVTMFIDSCYSGQIRTGETLLASARPVSIMVQETAYPPEFTVITASAADQIASSSPDLKHGIFSYYLMKGLEGEADENKDGTITIGKLQSYLAERVPRFAMTMSRKQEPQLTGDANRVLVNR